MSALLLALAGGACSEEKPLLRRGNVDGDCLLNFEEEELGTDPREVDSDGDGDEDCHEIACGSDPTDGDEVCDGCNWPGEDPGNLMSTGSAEGDVIANISLTDQCHKPFKLWDVAGEYHILYLTAAW